MVEESVPFNRKGMEKEIKATLSVYNSRVEKDGAEVANDYLAKKITEIFCKSLEAVEVIIPKGSIIIENQSGVFEKVISTVKGSISV